MMQYLDDPLLDKALESLAGAESEYVSERYNNATNRCYHTAFQAAIVALQRAGVATGGDQWSHAFVPSQFDGVLLRRRHLYSAELRGTLGYLFGFRQKAGYHQDSITATEAGRILRRTRTIVRAIVDGGSGR